MTLTCFGVRTIFLDLTRDKIAAGYLEFFRRCVARQFNDFEPVAQGGMDGIEPIRSGDEEHAGKVERQIEVMIRKGVILLRIEHFEQSRGGIPAEIGPDFVDLVEENDRITAFDASETLNDASGKRADISAAMAANFGFVMHATKGDAGEFPAQGVGDAFAQGGFSHTGRAYEAKNRSFQAVVQLDNGNKLQKTIFDFC